MNSHLGDSHSFNDWKSWKVWEHLTSAVVLSSLVFTFLTIFFYTYVTNVERSVFDSELVNTFDSLSVDPKSTRFVLDSIPSETNTETREKVRKEWQQRNESIQYDSWSLVSVVFGLCIVFSIVMSLLFNFSIFQLWVRSLIYLSFIGLTEFMFLLLVTREYSSVSPVRVKRIIGEKVRDEQRKKQNKQKQ